MAARGAAEWRRDASRAGLARPAPRSRTFDRLLNARTRVVAFANVSNVLAREPGRRHLSRARAAGALTLVDGAQAAPHLPLDVAASGCDSMRFSAAQMLGRRDRRRVLTP